MTQRAHPHEDAAAEYSAVRHAVGLIDRGDLGVLQVTGRDRAAFLHAMLSNDVKSLAVGQGCAATFLDVHGKVQALLVVLALEDRLDLLTPPGLAAVTLEALDKYLFSEKASFRDATGELTLLMLAGPDAPPTAARLAGTAPPEAGWSHTTGTIDGAGVRLVRGGGETGEAEVWLVAGSAEHDRLWRAATAAGARAVGPTAWESLRVEAGTPAFGRDVDGSVLLPEVAGFERLVSYTKGCYIGQEVVVRIRDRGHVNRQPRGLLLESDVIPPADAPVTAGGAEIGRVTSAAWSLGLKRPIALAYVRRQHAEPGTALAVLVDGRNVPATVSALPFPR
jgi:folate-binding protein YgfZ